MLLTDYLRSEKDITWDLSKQCGVTHSVIRLPETKDFDISNKSPWKTIYKRFIDYGIKPVIIEPMPNAMHDHIKKGDAMRDESIEKVIKMFSLMRDFDIHTLCFNFMACIGWLRTSDEVKERGGALVTEYNENNFKATSDTITEEQLWKNYKYFIKAVVPEAEKYEILLALHPDDPPVPTLGGLSRIMVSPENIKKAVYDIVQSDNLGITMCQANFYLMGTSLDKVISDFAKKIFFVHFRNVTGVKNNFRETFHDNGDLNMAHLIKLYKNLGIDVPIRVDHVPLMCGENNDNPGYSSIGRLFAIGYLKGLLEASE